MNSFEPHKFLLNSYFYYLYFTENQDLWKVGILPIVTQLIMGTTWNSNQVWQTLDSLRKVTHSNSYEIFIFFIFQGPTDS
jgi:NADH:ubiquinone oxidoreductase subunit H